VPDALAARGDDPGIPDRGHRQGRALRVPGSRNSRSAALTPD